MKQVRCLLPFLIRSLLRGTVLGLAVSTGFSPEKVVAADLFWDANGATAGAGSAPTGTWGTDSFWNTDATGGAGTFGPATTSADNLTFVAGPGATSGNGAYTVSLSGDQSANRLTFQSTGAITLGSSSTSISLGTGGMISPDDAYGSTDNAANPTINSNLILQGNQSWNFTRGTLTVNGVISGTGNLSLSGNFAKTFSNANTYTGTTTLNGGTNLTLTGAAGSVGTGAVNLVGSFSILTFNNTFDRTFSNAIIGAGNGSIGVTKTGATTLTLTGANTYSGGTHIANGAISVLSIGTNLGSGTIRLGSTTATGTLIYTGSGETVNRTVALGGTSGGGVIRNNGSGALVFANNLSITTNGTKSLSLQGTNGDNNELQGIIPNSGSGSTSIVKSESGKWILSGANTYTGSTTINGGTLLINGNQSAATGAVNVNNTGTLGGTGTIGGSVTAAAGSSLAPGADGVVGNLTLAANLNLSGLAAGSPEGLLFDMGSSGDSFTLTSGLLTIGAGVLEFDDFDFTALSGFGSGIYTLFDSTQIISGALGSNLSGSIAGFDATLSLANSGQDLILTVVPEPSCCLLLSLGLGAIVLSRRRTIRN